MGRLTVEQLEYWEVSIPATYRWALKEIRASWKERDDLNAENLKLQMQVDEMEVEK